MLFVPSETHTAVITDASGRIWYEPFPGARREILARADDVCGFGPFSSGPNDPFRPACIWHDRAYVQKVFFEDRGWNRKKIDRYFLKLMLDTAGNSRVVKSKAYIYYAIVRAVGGILYNRR